MYVSLKLNYYYLFTKTTGLYKKELTDYLNPHTLYLYQWHEKRPSFWQENLVFDHSILFWCFACMEWSDYVLCACIIYSWRTHARGRHFSTCNPHFISYQPWEGYRDRGFAVCIVEALLGVEFWVYSTVNRGCCSSLSSAEPSCKDIKQVELYVTFHVFDNSLQHYLFFRWLCETYAET